MQRLQAYYFSATELDRKPHLLMDVNPVYPRQASNQEAVVIQLRLLISASGRVDHAIVEHDLAAALRAIPESARGWQAEKVSVQCQSCKAVSVFDPGKISQSCQFCGSTSLVPYEQVKEAIRPESLLPMKVSEPVARESIRGWYGRQWLAPNGFAGKATTDTVKGLYLPYWTFDANVLARWTADSGEYYYVDRKSTRLNSSHT